MRWVLLLAVVGCASSTAMMGPDGTQHFSVKCAANVDGCYGKATESCPSGYDIIDRGEQTNVTMVNGLLVTSHMYNMLVKCREARYQPVADKTAPPAPDQPAWQSASSVTPATQP